MKIKEEIQDILDDWMHSCKTYKQLNKAIMKAINKRVKNIDIGEIFKDFIWSDDTKDVSDLIIHIKKSIIKEMR